MSAYSIAARGLAGRKVPQGTLTPIGTLLFSAAEPGAWYDPSNLSTLFQDEAGSIPVTAVEQPVGRMLDLSGRGNHASQATTTKRPVLSARYNLLLNSDLFGAVAGAPGTPPTSWSNATLTGSITSVADGITFSASSARRSIRQSIRVVAGQVITAKVQCAVVSGVVQVSTVIAHIGGLFSSVQYRLNGIDVSASFVIPAGAPCEVSVIYGIGTTGSFGCDVGIGTQGNTTGEVKITNASISLATDAHLPYQRVNTATDYDADPSKFPAYRRLDGVDDSHASATGGGGNAGVFFSAAVTPQGGAGTARTLFSDAGANTGYVVRLNTSNQLELAAGNGTTYTTIATAGTLAVGSTDIVQAWDDGTNLNVKIGNGPTASIARPTVSAGTAGYTMGQGNGASTGYFNGRAYSTIYLKDSGLTQVQRESVALYQRQKARLP